MKVPSPSLLGCEFLALAVARINHSLALRARIFSKQKSKPSNTSPTRKRASEWFDRLSDNVWLYVSGGFGRCALPERAPTGACSTLPKREGDSKFIERYCV